MRVALLLLAAFLAGSGCFSGSSTHEDAGSAAAPSTPAECPVDPCEPGVDDDGRQPYEVHDESYAWPRKLNDQPPETDTFEVPNGTQRLRAKITLLLDCPVGFEDDARIVFLTPSDNNTTWEVGMGMAWAQGGCGTGSSEHEPAFHELATEDGDWTLRIEGQCSCDAQVRVVSDPEDDTF